MPEISVHLVPVVTNLFVTIHATKAICEPPISIGATLPYKPFDHLLRRVDGPVVFLAFSSFWGTTISATSSSTPRVLDIPTLQGQEICLIASISQYIEIKCSGM